LWPDKPLIKSAAANFNCIAHLFNWKGVYMFTYELVFSQGAAAERIAPGYQRAGQMDL